MVVVKRASLYFALVFAVGFLLGPVRVLWLAPWVGERAAELIESPFMLLAIVVSARFVVRRFPSNRPSGLLLSGGLALLLLISIEFTVVLALRGLTLSSYVAARDPVSGLAYLVLLILFGVMPWALGHGEESTVD